jgi:predicted membrane protein
MNANECRQERFSSRTIGLMFLTVSFLLFVIGLLVLPVVGFIFAVPFVLIGLVMLAAPESRACQMIRRGLKAE